MQYIPLRNVSKRVKREVVIEPNEIYKTLGCKLYGLGVYKREEKLGINIRAKKMNLVKENDFVVNRIWAQKGSVGIVPEELSGYVVTNDFPVFKLHDESIIPEYLGWYVRTRDFWEECKRHSHGTSGRERISPKELPNVLLPLHPISEQRKIVSWLNEVVPRIEKGLEVKQNLQNKILDLEKSLLLKVFDTDTTKYPVKLLSDICVKIADIDHRMPKSVDSGIDFVSPKDFTDRGIDFSNCKQISQLDYDRLRRKIQPRVNDILYSRIGTVGEARLVENDHDFISSYSIVTIRPNNQIILPKFLLYALQSPNILHQALTGVRAIAMPDLGLGTIKNFLIPTPSIIQQKEIIRFLDGIILKIDSLGIFNKNLSTDLETLIASVLETTFNPE